MFMLIKSLDQHNGLKTEIEEELRRYKCAIGVLSNENKRIRAERGEEQVTYDAFRGTDGAQGEALKVHRGIHKTENKNENNKLV
jgi:hypothetical protein